MSAWAIRRALPGRALMSPIALLLLLVLSACAGGATPSAGSSTTAPTAAPAGAAQAASAPTAPPAPIKLTLNWTAPGSNHTPIWLAQAAGIFREQGLDVDLVNIPGSSTIIQTMLAGELQLSPLDPATGVQATLNGAEVMLLYAMNNRLNFAVMAQPAIREPRDLNGKILGITRVGSATHTAALVALGGWGLAPDRDVSLRNLGEITAINAALEAGQIDAGIITLPLPLPLKRGYNQLVDLSSDGPEYPSIAVGARRAWIDANPDAVLRFGRAFVIANFRARRDKAAALDTYRKYIRADDQERLDDLYASFLRIVPEVPDISEPGMVRVLDDLARDEPRLVGRPQTDFVERRFVRELEQSGFIQQARAAQ
jgi:NitT/TauT family transport system substrate-binding protein